MLCVSCCHILIRTSCWHMHFLFPFFVCILSWWHLFVIFCALSGEWKNLEFKEYNFNAKGQPIEGGHLHPLNKARICFSFSIYFFSFFHSNLINTKLVILYAPWEATVTICWELCNRIWENNNIKTKMMKIATSSNFVFDMVEFGKISGFEFLVGWLSGISDAKHHLVTDIFDTVLLQEYDNFLIKIRARYEVN